jgi:hypothetical protein
MSAAQRLAATDCTDAAQAAACTAPAARAAVGAPTAAQPTQAPPSCASAAYPTRVLWQDRRGLMRHGPAAVQLPEPPTILGQRVCEVDWIPGTVAWVRRSAVELRADLTPAEVEDLWRQVRALASGATSCPG